MSEDAGASQSRRVARSRDGKAKVRLVTHPSAEASETGLGKTVFEHEDEVAARRFIETNYPRGAEAVLQSADGKVSHFSADLKAQGHENDGWQERE